MSPDLPSRPSPTGAATGAAPASAAAGAPSTSRAAARPTGDLDTGSTTHVLGAGAAQLVVDYWTTQDPGSWTPDVRATVQLAAHLEGAGAATETRVSRFTATGTGDDGRQVPLVDDEGAFVLTAPYSYSSALLVPASARGAQTTSVRLQWDLLVETAPGSGQFARQTVVDTLTIALARPAGARTSTPRTTPKTSPSSTTPDSLGARA